MRTAKKSVGLILISLKKQTNKQTTLHVQHTFLNIVVLHDYNVKLPSCTEEMQYVLLFAFHLFHYRLFSS